MLTDAGVLNAHQELGLKRKDIERLAAIAYHPKDIGAAIASGSFLTEGMVIAPCSMKTLAAVAHAHADDLVSRAADVVLKERRRLVLLPREAPLNLAHLRNMVQVTEMGGVVFPPVPAFYARPKTHRGPRRAHGARACSTSSASIPRSSPAGRASMPEPAVFSGTYAEARAKFVDAARGAGATVYEYRHPSQKGPAGEALCLDVAVAGPEDAERVLVAGSGTHGIEGYSGLGGADGVAASAAARSACPGARRWCSSTRTIPGASRTRRAAPRRTWT